MGIRHENKNGGGPEEDKNFSTRSALRDCLMPKPQCQRLQRHQSLWINNWQKSMTIAHLTSVVEAHNRGVTSHIKEVIHAVKFAIQLVGNASHLLREKIVRKQNHADGGLATNIVLLGAGKATNGLHHRYRMESPLPRVQGPSSQRPQPTYFVQGAAATAAVVLLPRSCEEETSDEPLQ